MLRWREMSAVRKAFFFICILCVVAGIILLVLDTMNIGARIDIFEDIVDCIFWLSVGIVFWKKGTLYPIICFIGSGLNLIFIFI